MKNFLEDKEILELINRYPEDKRDLLSRQIRNMNKIINDSFGLYCINEHYRQAMDNVLKSILYGKFL